MPTLVRLLAGCALATALLAGCGETGVRPPVSLEAADSADQVLEKIRHYVATDGIRRSLVEADTAFYYEATQTFELRSLTVTFYNTNGVETSVITAREGSYRTVTGSMEARGDVLVRSPNGGRRLRTQKLVYDQPSNELSSDQFFTYDEGTDHLEGNGFRSDPDFRNVIAAQPRARQGTERGGMLLPGQ